ncbi:hypothetical protein O6H91_Y049200 [Diphasiastrum complanatum]|nr:hypothetical protein O6H91_Y049200 [Diphasiastrum complanatum]
MVSFFFLFSVLVVHLNRVELQSKGKEVLTNTPLIGSIIVSCLFMTEIVR